MKEYQQEPQDKSMDKVHVVTAFIEKQGQVLLLRRSNKVGTYHGKWSGVSGYLDCEDALEQTYIEISEETAIKKENLTLESIGKTIEIRDDQLNRVWIVHPFKFSLNTNIEIKIDWENTEFNWFDPAEIPSLDTVPGLSDAYKNSVNK